MEEHIYWKLFLSYAAVLALSIVIMFFVKISLISFTLILVMITAYSTWLSSFFISNIDRLSDAIFEISKGNYRPVIAKTSSEFRRIEEAINDLQERLIGTIGELSASQGKLKAILSSMAEGVMAVDAGGNVILLNRAAGEMLGLIESEVTGRNFVEMIRHPDITSSIRAAFSGGSQEKEIGVSLPQERKLLVHAVPVSGGGVVTVMNDITRLKKLESIRTEFTANVSHELKTPLTSIKASAETLIAGAVNDKENNIDFLNKIMKNSERLSALIDDILQLSSLDEGRTPKDVKPVDAAAIIDRALDTISAKIKQKKIKISVDIGDGPVEVICSEDHLYRVFLNLLDNAVKYNKEGGSVTITGRPYNGQIEFEVADTGIGIDAEHLPRIFERFYTTDKARSRELGGTGLGLSIVKHIVELYGGKAAVSSRINEGSTFTFTLNKA